MRVGLIGNPVEHSRSPRMHNAAFAALNLNHVYELWHTEAEDVGTRVGSIRQADIAGANVTVPHKEAVIPFLDEISETARRIGAVNTIIPRDDRLIGDNTDAYGFATSIAPLLSEIPRTAVVLGAGGASRAIVVALQDLGAGTVVIANRTASKAEALAAELGGQGVGLDVLPQLLPDTDVLVNASALGWHNEVALPHDQVAMLPASAVVVDLTYRHTPLLQSAEKLGLGYQDGLGMLIHQGVRSFELWFGITPPVDVMTRAALDV